MSSGWMIQTFDREKWDCLFASRGPELEQKLLDAMLWDADGYFQESGQFPQGPNRDQVLASRRGQEARGLASHIVRNGFTYDGLDAPGSVLLDEFASDVFDEEALGDDLDTAWHSPDHVSMGMVEELLYRQGNLRFLPLKPGNFVGRQLSRAPARLLPLLLTGRRLGTEAEPTRSVHSFYVILSPDEVVQLRDEAGEATGGSIAWRFAEVQPALTEEYLLAPLDEVIKGGRWVAMTCRF